MIAIIFCIPRLLMGRERENISASNLDVLVADFPDTYKLMKLDEVSKIYSFLESYVSYCKSRAVSAGQRERAREHM